MSRFVVVATLALVCAGCASSDYVGEWRTPGFPLYPGRQVHPGTRSTYLKMNANHTYTLTRENAKGQRVSLHLWGRWAQGPQGEIKTNSADGEKGTMYLIDSSTMSWTLDGTPMLLHRESE